jgi:2-polyprenyl-3-methyl-5-hydroxy-6-metoxy-1,4-benzoquinol methylase
MTKATSELAVGNPRKVQQGNKSWWTTNTMSYDWKDKIKYPKFSLDWFDEVDRRFVGSSRHFAHDDRLFGKLIPFEQLRGKSVLEVGCGMGLHTELMSRAGADVLAIDVSPTSVEATRSRLKLKRVPAAVEMMDVETLSIERKFDFIWSWGVIHHSSRTGRAFYNLCRAAKPNGEIRFMVYNLEGMQAYSMILLKYLVGFWRGRSLDELLWQSTDGFMARYFTQDSIVDLCRIFCDDVSVEVFGLESDAIPLPSAIRTIAKRVIPDTYIAKRIRTRGSFLFVTAVVPDRLDLIGGQL